MAAIGGFINTVDYLIEHTGADVNARDNVSCIIMRISGIIE